MMAYEEGTHGGVGSRYLGEGFRQEPDFREGTGALPVLSSPATSEGRPAGRSANLDLVFDDPAVGEPGRDQMLVHGLWELVLVAAVGVLGYALINRHGDDIAGGPRAVLVAAAGLGLLAAAAAVTLRAAVPNLAVGFLATAAGLYCGHNVDRGTLATLLVVIAVTAIIGAVQGVVTVGLQVPGWASSLGVVMVLGIWSSRQAPVESVLGYNPVPHGYWWFGGLAVASVAAGLVGIVPAIRRNFGRFRAVADPAVRRGTAAAVIALGATVVSSVLAGLAGFLMVFASGRADPTGGLELTALALGVAMLGGTSAFGRRGGVFGTVLAALLVTEVIAYIRAANDNPWPAMGVAAAALAVGLVVTRLVERFGRPFNATTPDEVSDWEAFQSRMFDDGRRHAAAPASTGVWANADSWGTER